MNMLLLNEIPKQNIKNTYSIWVQFRCATKFKYFYKIIDFKGLIPNN